MGVATDKYAIVSPKFRNASALEVPVFQDLVYGTHLIGIFCCGNSSGILMPYFTTENEVSRIRKKLEPLGVSVGIVEDHYTSIGNLVAVNDNCAIASPLVKNLELISDVLDVEVVCMDVEGHLEVGSCIEATNRGFIAHPDCGEILDNLKDMFGVAGRTGTVNYGVPYVSTGILANSFGAIVGGKTTGIEMGRIDEALGFL